MWRIYAHCHFYKIDGKNRILNELPSFISFFSKIVQQTSESKCQMFKKTYRIGMNENQGRLFWQKWKDASKSCECVFQTNSKEGTPKNMRGTDFDLTSSWTECACVWQKKCTLAEANSNRSIRLHEWRKTDDIKTMTWLLGLNFFNDFVCLYKRCQRFVYIASCLRKVTMTNNYNNIQ